MKSFFLISFFLLSFYSAKGQSCDEWAKTANYSLNAIFEYQYVVYKCHKCYKSTALKVFIVLKYPDYNLTDNSECAKKTFEDLIYYKGISENRSSIYKTKCSESYSENHLWEEKENGSQKYKVFINGPGGNVSFEKMN